MVLCDQTTESHDYRPTATIPSLCSGSVGWMLYYVGLHICGSGIVYALLMWSGKAKPYLE